MTTTGPLSKASIASVWLASTKPTGSLFKNLLRQRYFGASAPAAPPTREVRWSELRCSAASQSATSIAPFPHRSTILPREREARLFVDFTPRAGRGRASGREHAVELVVGHDEGRRERDEVADAAHDDALLARELVGGEAERVRARRPRAGPAAGGAARARRSARRRAPRRRRGARRGRSSAPGSAGRRRRARARRASRAR